MSSVQSYLAAREKGVRWLLEQSNPDGSIGPVAEGINYYRVPWALAVCGRIAEAMRALDWVQENMFTADGDFSGSYPRGDYDTCWYSYPNANLVFGARLLGRFEISQPGIQFLKRNFRDKESGGFFNHKGRTGADGEQATWITCQAGLSCLATGQLDAARQVGAWLRRLWDAQPELPDKLYTVWSPARGLLTELSQKSAEDRKAYVVEAQARAQWYFEPGIAAAFLGGLFQATREPPWLALARRYQDFAMNMTDQQFEVPQVCKTGWGAAVLCLITSEPQYRRWAQRVGDYYLASQLPDGHWQNIAPHQSARSNVEITAEFVMHLNTLMGALSK